MKICVFNLGEYVHRTSDDLEFIQIIEFSCLRLLRKHVGGTPEYLSLLQLYGAEVY